MRHRFASSFSVIVAAALLLMVAGTAGAARPADAFRLAGGAAIIKDGTIISSGAKPVRGDDAPSRAASPSALASIIVKLDVAPLATYRGGLAGLPATSPSVTGRRVDVQSPDASRYLAHVGRVQRDFEGRAAASGGRVTHRYDIVFGGVAMLVAPDKVADIARLPGVVAVYYDTLIRPQAADAGPAAIGAPALWAELGGQEEAGEGVVVGILDSGIWPELPSFSDPDPLGKLYAAPPAPVSGARACEFSGGANPGPAFACNNKLIGADRFMATYDAVIGLLPTEFTSARDDNGHGTHTASTAAGNRGVSASIFGIDRGIVSGIAPRAHVMAYKVCGDEGCFQSDSVGAVQESILDGVNTINFSISGGENPYADAVELAFLDAYQAGIFVAASAGNSGPTADTVSHRGPWVTTVAASTLNRGFLSTVTIFAGPGRSLRLTGASVTTGITSPTPVVNAASAPYNDKLCLNSTADGAFAGKIVICERGGGIGRIQKSFNVSRRGAVGMILYNPTPQGLNTDNHYVPSIHIENTDGARLLAFLAANPGATITATLTQGTASLVPGDVVAPFSSRGGAGQGLGIGKPDVTAPGVQILAGNTPQPATELGGPAGESFQSIQGTSMSSPHVAGAAALLKDRHPSWTPGQIKAALMTTANQRVTTQGGDTYTAFDAGSGRIDLTRAADPGVTFDATGAQYIALKDELYKANYPSFYHPSLPGTITVQRTIKSVLPTTATWAIDGRGLGDVDITVSPRVIRLAPGAEATFDITIDARDVPLGEVRFASLKLSDGNRTLHFPITFVRGAAPVTLAKTCDPATIRVGQETTCTITVTNPTFEAAQVNVVDTIPSRLRLVPGSATGGATESGNRVLFTTTIAGAAPPDVTAAIAPGSTPAGGYLPLSLFGIAPVTGVTDDSLTNFNVPAFRFAGETYTRIGFSSNGYAVVGGGSGADNTFINQEFPDPSRPNNVLSPFWTDLNPPAGGALRIGTLTDGVNSWLVLDWEGVREFSAPRVNSFQIWIGINGVEDITYAYGTLQGNGDVGFLTVGAENRFGNRGANVYIDGAGTLPTNGTEIRVTGTSAAAPGTATITFRAQGVTWGPWVNYVEMTSRAFTGTAIARYAGEVRGR